MGRQLPRPLRPRTVDHESPVSVGAIAHAVPSDMLSLVPAPLASAPVASVWGPCGDTLTPPRQRHTSHHDDDGDGDFINFGDSCGPRLPDILKAWAPPPPPPPQARPSHADYEVAGRGRQKARIPPPSSPSFATVKMDPVPSHLPPPTPPRFLHLGEGRTAAKAAISSGVPNRGRPRRWQQQHQRGFRKRKTTAETAALHHPVGVTAVALCHTAEAMILHNPLPPPLVDYDLASTSVPAFEQETNCYDVDSLSMLTTMRLPFSPIFDASSASSTPPSSSSSNFDGTKDGIARGWEDFF